MKRTNSFCVAAVLTAIMAWFIFSTDYSGATVGVQITYPKFKAWSVAGKPLAAGKLYSYEPNSSTPKALYTTRTLATAHANPVVLDSNGEAAIWGSGAYKLVLKTSADVLVWSMDYVNGIGGTDSNSTQYVETYGGTGDGSADDSAAVAAAIAACPTNGPCHVIFSCGKTWTFNVTITKPNVWLEGCGAQSNTYWSANQWQAYDKTKPLIKVDSVTYGAEVRPNTGFQLTNAHLNGSHSSGNSTLDGQYGLHIRSSEYHNIDNVNIEYFTGYQILLGDSDLTTGQEWVYFGNFNDMTVKAHVTKTTGDTIKLIQSGSSVTSQYFNNINLYGPFAAGSGYALNNVTDVRFTNGYFQVAADHGLYKNRTAVNGKYNLNNVTVEGTATTDCVVTSTHAGSNSNGPLSVLEAHGVDFTGSYCDGDGTKWDLSDTEAVSQSSVFYIPSMVSGLNFVTGNPNYAGAYISYDTQNDATHRAFIRRSYNGYTWDDGLDIYGTNGTRIEAGSTTKKPTLSLVGKNTDGYPLSISGPYISGYFQTSQDDNGSTALLYPVARFTRNNSNVDTCCYGAADGYGSYFDLRLSSYDSTGASKLGEAQAAKISWLWVDSDAASLDSALTFSVVSSSKSANSSLDIMDLREGKVTLSSHGKTNGTRNDIAFYFTDAGGTSTWANNITNTMDDATAGSIDSSMSFNTMANGTSATHVKVTNRGLWVASFTPASSTATCTAGEITYDDNTTATHLYICYGDNNWVRQSIPHASW